jgi:ankyrin repeat protein
MVQIYIWSCFTGCGGKYGDTLLHLACEHRNTLPVELFKVLIERHGANVNAQAKHKDTPIRFAKCSIGNQQ